MEDLIEETVITEGVRDETVNIDELVINVIPGETISTSTNDVSPSMHLCEVCGSLEECECIQPIDVDNDTRSYSVDHSYSDGNHISARTHQRTGQVLTKKRQRFPAQWKCATRKRLRQSGQSYINTKGHSEEAKSVKTCKRNHKICRFKCDNNFNEDDREEIHREHWGGTDDEKRQFYVNTTHMVGKLRTRRAVDENKKKISYSFFFKKNNDNIRVCKDFYLCTLDIDAKRVVNTHKSVNQITGTAAPYHRGNKINGSNPSKDYIRRHIESIPKVESHYCRRDTNKDYISGNLSIQILYEKYVDKCTEMFVQPEKVHAYRYVFNNEYNIGFQNQRKIGVILVKL